MSLNNKTGVTGGIDAVDVGTLLLTDNCFICNETLNIFTRGNQTVDEVRLFKKLFCSLFDVDCSTKARLEFTENDSNVFCLKCARSINNIKISRDAITNKLVEKSQIDSQNHQNQTPNWNLKSHILHKWGGEKFAFLAGEKKSEKVQEKEAGNNVVETIDISKSPRVIPVARLIRPRQQKVHPHQPINVEMNPAIAIKIEHLTSRLPIEVDFVSTSEESGGNDQEQGPTLMNENSVYDNNSRSNSNDDIIMKGGNSDLTINYIPYNDDNDGVNYTSATPMDYLQLEQNNSSSGDNFLQRRKNPQRSDLKEQLKKNQAGDQNETEANLLPKPPGAGQTFFVNGVRYYSCRYCSKTFNHRSNKYRHENSIHGDVIRQNVLKRMLNSSSLSSNNNVNVVVENNKNNNNLNQQRTTTRSQPQLPLQNRSRKTDHQCKICNRYMSSNWSLQNHIQVYHAAAEGESEPVFRCTTCFKPYNTKESLSRHQVKHNPKTFYNCSFCADASIGYSNKRDLLNHISRVHPENSTTNDNNISQLEPHNIKCEVTINEIDEEFVMPILEKMVLDDEDENPDDDDDDGQNDNSEEEEEEETYAINISQKQNLYPDRKSMPFKCRICGKGFGYIQNKKRHEDRHKDPNSLVSKLSRRQQGGPGSSIQSIIARRLKNRRLVNQHNRIRKRVECQHCGKSLSDIHILRNHVQAFHTGVFNFECYVCGKPYASKDSCRKHEKSHDPNKPFYFTCPRELDCDHRFIKWPQFVNHFEEAHPGISLPKFKQKVRPQAPRVYNNDNEGNQEFNDDEVNEDIRMVLSALKEQSRGLKGGPCSCFYCGKPVRNNFMLARHIKAIHGAKPLKCRYSGCNRRFGLTSSRTNHEQTHVRRNFLINSVSNNGRKQSGGSQTTTKSSAATTTTTLGDFEKRVKVSLEKLDYTPNLSPRIRQQLDSQRSTPSLSSGRTSASFSPLKKSIRGSRRVRRSGSTGRRKSQPGQGHDTSSGSGSKSSNSKVRSLENELISMKSGKLYRCWICSKEKFHEGFCHYNSIRIHFQRWPSHDVSLNVAQQIMKELNLESEGILPATVANQEQEPHDVSGDYQLVEESQNDNDDDINDNEEQFKKIQDSKKYSDLIIEETNDNVDDDGEEDSENENNNAPFEIEVVHTSSRSAFEENDGENEKKGQEEEGGVEKDNDEEEEGIEIEDVNMEELFN